MAFARLPAFAGAHASLGFASLRGRFAALRAARSSRVLPYPHRVAKLLRRIAIALLLALLVGLAIGTVIRVRLSRPVVYIGDARSARGPLPLHVGHAGAPVRDARSHEQQIG